MKSAREIRSLDEKIMKFPIVVKIKAPIGSSNNEISGNEANTLTALESYPREIGI